MRTVSALLTVLTLWLPTEVLSQTSSTYVVDNVTVIDVVAGTAVPNQRVVVTGSRITSVGTAANTPAPPNATTVDGGGKFLIPGLWDMHVHIAGPLTSAGRMFGLFLANGITREGGRPRPARCESAHRYPQCRAGPKRLAWGSVSQPRGDRPDARAIREVGNSLRGKHERCMNTIEKRSPGFRE